MDTKMKLEQEIDKIDIEIIKTKKVNERKYETKALMLSHTYTDS